MNKSAASAASPDFVNFQAVIKLAASAASRKPKIQGSAWATARLVDDSLVAVPWIVGFLEEALAADLIMA